VPTVALVPSAKGSSFLSSSPDVPSVVPFSCEAALVAAGSGEFVYSGILLVMEEVSLEGTLEGSLVDLPHEVHNRVRQVPNNISFLFIIVYSSILIVHI